MLIERVANNYYVKYLEATSKAKVKQSDVDKLANEVTSNWWNKNQHHFLKILKID